MRELQVPFTLKVIEYDHAVPGLADAVPVMWVLMN